MSIVYISNVFIAESCKVSIVDSSNVSIIDTCKVFIVDNSSIVCPLLKVVMCHC